MTNSQPENAKSFWLDKPIFLPLPKITLEHLLVTIIILLTVISRFYMVGERVMSHDEVNHVVPSYELYTGQGYSHNPVTHGPMQFHLLAASYFLFGDTDFVSRAPSAVFSIATVVFVLFAFRRYLGRTGALLSGLFFMISPFMLFYGRYTRNEAFIGLFSVVLLYAVLHYLEKGKHSTLYLYTAVLALYFCTKETSFIFTAEMLIFLALIFIKDVNQKEWRLPANRSTFILLTIVALLFLGVTLGLGVISSKTTSIAAPATLDPAMDGLAAVSSSLPVLKIMEYVFIGLTALALVLAIVLVLRGFGWKNLCSIRSFDLLLLTFTLVLPQLIAFPISMLGWDPLDYSQTGLIRTGIMLILVVAIAVALGLLWKPTLWLKNMGLFYAIFTILYTTLFTNGQGFFTGLVGSLGYWLSQQSVNRGTQPLYYYVFPQLSMYEYLAVLGSIVALIVGIKHKLLSSNPNLSPAQEVEMEKALNKEPLASTTSLDGQSLDSSEIETPVTQQGSLSVSVSNTATSISAEPVEEDPKRLPILVLLLYWFVMSLLAFSVAGEKMPWLTVHITLPALLAAGFGLGYLVDTLVVEKWNLKAGFSLILLPVFLIGLGKAISSLLGDNKPFAGQELLQLQTTSTFLFSVAAVILSGWGIFKFTEGMKLRIVLKSLLLAFFAALAVLTARSSFQASFINYDYGNEFLVYAHSARGPKDILEQVEDISLRTTGGKDVKVAYIGDALYPYWWYFRDYPNKTWFKDNLTHELEQYPVVISDDVYDDKTRAILGANYFEFKYKRMVWPMQDYWNQTLKTFWQAVKDPQMRQAIFDIWLNKDYTLYASIKGLQSLTIENWEPSGQIYLFIDKSLVNSIWTYGTVPSATVAPTDPYADKMTDMTPDMYFGSIGTKDGQFTNPHGIAIAQNGDIYVADARNHRIQHFSADGQFINAWGSYASIDSGNAPGGTFNEPWGIAVGPDGSVYVADTWNYRIQKFTADGKFITMWGSAGTAAQPDTFWGPRGIVVNHQNQVLITDTGNNRVVVFDSNGNYLTQFGSNGIDAGSFDEPVGLAVDSQDNVYVVDTWNRRIQVFAENPDSSTYLPIRQWQVSGWKGQSVNNKPFIAVNASGNVYVTDPDQFRVLEFDSYGNFVKGWGSYSSGIDGFGMPIGIAVDQDNRIWVSDSENSYLLRFTVPIESSTLPMGLPALPASNNPLTYNFESGLVEGPFQQPVYRLDSESMEWIPIIPAGTLAMLPSDTRPIKSKSGEWMLYQTDGTPAFKWEPDLLLWLSVAPPLPAST